MRGHHGFCFQVARQIFHEGAYEQAEETGEYHTNGREVVSGTSARGILDLIVEIVRSVVAKERSRRGEEKTQSMITMEM